MMHLIRQQRQNSIVCAELTVESLNYNKGKNDLMITADSRETGMQERCLGMKSEL